MSTAQRESLTLVEKIQALERELAIVGIERAERTRLWNVAREELERVSSIRNDLADLLVSLLHNGEIACDCPRSDLEIGGQGHHADCATSVARAALRAAGRTP